jgi:hypothetical protein
MLRKVLEASLLNRRKEKKLLSIFEFNIFLKQKKTLFVCNRSFKVIQILGNAKMACSRDLLRKKEMNKKVLDADSNMRTKRALTFACKSQMKKYVLIKFVGPL